MSITLFTEAKCWKQPFTSKWMYQKTGTFTQWNNYTAETKKELLPFATAWMDLESIMLNKINQAAKDKYIWSHLEVEPNQQNK